MPKKKRNHFVGRGIVQFWANQQGQVTYWEKDADEKLELRNPKSVHYADYLYASWDESGNRRTHAEDALAAEIDNLAPRHVQAIVDGFSDVLPIPADRRAFLARMVLRTITRNPVMLGSLSSAPQTPFLWAIYRLKRWLKRSRTPDQAYDKLGRDRVIAGEMISDLVTINIDQRVKTLSEKRFAFLVPEKDAANFILGSQPYFINPNMLSDACGEGRKKDAFCGVVIHPRMLLAIFDDCDEDEIATASQEDMQRINGLFVKYSSSVVMVDPRDIEGAWYRPLGGEDGGDIRTVNLVRSN